MAAFSSCFSPKICTKNPHRIVIVGPPSTKALSGPSHTSFSRFPISKCVHLIAESDLVTAAAEVSPDLKNAAAGFSTQTSKTSHVKFQLQKECMFGDQILLVGDHPILGSWDPENALPMNWSNGHIWIVELDVPTETTMQFKFILKRSTGDICWQPGADRIFKSWESKAILIIAEDWENPGAQKVTEEQGTKSIISGNVDSNISFSADTAYANDKLNLDTEFFTRGISAYPMGENLMKSNREIKPEEAIKNDEHVFGYQGQVLAPGLIPQQAGDVLSGELGSTAVDSTME